MRAERVVYEDGGSWGVQQVKAGVRASNTSHISETSSSPAAQIIAASGLRWKKIDCIHGISLFVISEQFLPRQVWCGRAHLLDISAYGTRKHGELLSYEMFALCLFVGESLVFFSIRHMCDVINCSSRVVNVLGERIFGNTLVLAWSVNTLFTKHFSPRKNNNDQTMWRFNFVTHRRK